MRLILLAALAALEPELERVDLRLAQIDADLSRLPVIKGVNSTARLGYQSHLSPAQKWISLGFDPVLDARADSIALVPAISSEGGVTTPGYGFPRELTVQVDSPGSSEVFTVKRTRPESLHPHVIRFSARPVRRVLITATLPWERDEPAMLALAEVMILDGNLNIAPKARVGAKEPFHPGTANNRIWGGENLTDHETPLGLPVVPAPVKWKGYASAACSSQDQMRSISFDLGKEMPIDEIRLVPAHDPSFPRWNDFGFPHRFNLVASNDGSFIDKTDLCNVTERYETGPGSNVAVLHPRKPATARFIRLTSARMRERARDFILALAEFQIYSGGKNIATGLQATVDDSLNNPDWSIAALTDGEAPGGKLVEWPEWFRLLEARQKLEDEKSLLLANRPALVQAAQRRLQWIITTISVGLLLAAALWFLRREQARMREERRVRESLARDLHDEIGSNLAGIAVMSETSAIQGDATAEDWWEINRIARESSDAMREVLWLVGARQESGIDLMEHLQRVARRLLPNHQVTWTPFAGELPATWPMESRRQVFLFFKEALSNILRHAKATHVELSAQIADSTFELIIRDNGRGFDPAETSTGMGLHSLRERAKRLGGAFTLSSSAQGTTLTLRVPLAP